MRNRVRAIAGVEPRHSEAIPVDMGYVWYLNGKKLQPDLRAALESPQYWETHLDIPRLLLQWAMAGTVVLGLVWTLGDGKDRRR